MKTCFNLVNVVIILITSSSYGRADLLDDAFNECSQNPTVPKQSRAANETSDHQKQVLCVPFPHRNGDPMTCLRSQSCLAVLLIRIVDASYERQDGAVQKREKVHFKLVSRQAKSKYTAVGISDDTVMAEDFVVQCIRQGDEPHGAESSRSGGGEGVTLGTSFNGEHSNSPLSQDRKMVVFDRQDLIDGTSLCEWTIVKQFTVNDKEFDLNGRIFILLAHGPAGGPNGGLRLRKHEDYLISAPLSMSSNSEGLQMFNEENVSTVSMMVRWHGILMIVSWVGCSALGAMMAKFFKNPFQHIQVFGLDLWFVVHRLLMLMTASLEIIAFILILAHVRGWHTQPHTVFGIISIGLSLLQAASGLMRPAKTSARRGIFDYAHSIGGHVVSLLAWITLFCVPLLPGEVGRKLSTNDSEYLGFGSNYRALLIAFVVISAAYWVVLRIGQPLVTHYYLYGVKGEFETYSAGGRAVECHKQRKYNRTMYAILFVYILMIAYLVAHLCVVINRL